MESGLVSVHTSLDILLIREDKQQAVSHFAVVNDTMKCCPCLINTVAIGRVDDEDETLCT